MTNDEEKLFKKHKNTIKRLRKEIRQYKSQVIQLKRELKPATRKRHPKIKTRLQIKDILSIYDISRTTLWRRMNKKEKKLLPIDSNDNPMFYKVEDVISFCEENGIVRKNKKTDILSLPKN